MSENNEIQNVIDRYSRRSERSTDNLYNPLNPDVFMGQQQKERALIKLIKNANLSPVNNKHVLEIGCGSGMNLLRLVQLGFNPNYLIANELLEERALIARHNLPNSIKVLQGDAMELDLQTESIDIILQSTVFTSILDEDFKRKLANKIWSLIKPGGGIIWYDFLFNNPNNPDVKGIKVKEIHQLFPEGSIRVYRITLAPPLSRIVTKIHPSCYTLLNILPFLRTHVLCWIEKL